MLLDRHVDLQRVFGLYETETRDIVGPGSVVLDIGGGDGYESLGYAQLGAIVYAVDPDPAAVARLRRNLELKSGCA